MYDNTYLSAGHLLVLQSCLAKEHSSALLCSQGWPRPLGEMEAWEAGGGTGKSQEGFPEEVTLDGTGRNEEGMM